MTAALPDPILFIGGCPRSGTTLLRNILNRHSQLAVSPESSFLNEVFRTLYVTGRTNDLQFAWQEIREHPFFVRWELPDSAIRAVLAEHPPRSYGDLIRVLFAAHAAQQGKPLSADKTPYHALMFELLAEMFPTSRFVHVLRDPREVCMSLALQYFHFGGLAGAALWWQLHVGLAQRAAAVLGDRLLEVRYEELVADPQRELAWLCAWLDLPFEPALLESGQALEAAEIPRRDAAYLAPQVGLRRWESELTRDDLGLIEAIAGPTMRAVGYDPAVRWPSMRAMWEIARYGMREACRRWVNHRWGTHLPSLPRRLPAASGPFRPVSF
jgi:hypothetical protein